ncbi:hypothetical protein SODALDRAFT_330832 [Sodiomyces alkalinus F11]|uniref:NIMA interactive protein n=1 Tax=Sodiomyces alkalinus (strain CBS 110278 / VKM F-3762 / F11) TaxID=1314773 RepID=A0A3N2Q2X8_SODAK|nr:hypothetical protein SODALDRAFT_330832 [Sodiomyces alkalinus F11]ROT41124.1 hypothetical protein SODALDRAFT_330832 [Sodiomyces alkalinus F11]
MTAENENLRTASLYINNQLLSRGLLRDGQTIDFANPETNEGGTETTMGRIMNIVNDLILRRDRDAEQRESLSATLRALRAENLRYANDISRLTEKHAEARRKLEIAEASESALRSQLKSADAAVRGLKEETARAKTLVAQTRASCATEVRRRDRQIDGLKKQLGEAGRARGAAKNPTVTVINVVADVGQEGISHTRAGAGATAEQSYDLRSETNEFLTELAKNLGEENEALLAVVRRTLAKLREMGGWQEGHAVGQGDGHALTLQRNCAELESEMEAILEQIRTILTNPSFVPIEEVEVREEEINKLRDGWVKMETRWQEAVHLIDGWRKRMAANGRGVNMEELNMSLRLSPVKVRDVEETNRAAALRLSCVEEERTEDLEKAMRSWPCRGAGGTGNENENENDDESLQLEPAREYDVEVPGDDSESSIYQDDDELDDLEHLDDLDRCEPNVEILQQSTAYLSSPPLPLPPQLSPLKDSSSAGNRRTHDMGRKQSKPTGHFTTIAEENIWDLANDDISSELPSHRTQLPRSPQKIDRAPSCEPEEQPRIVSAATDSSLDEILLVRPPSPSGPPSPSPAPRQRPPRNIETKSVGKAKCKKAEFADNVQPPSSGYPINRRRDPSTEERRVANTTTTDNDVPPPPAAPGTAQQQTPSTRPVSSSRLPLPRPTNPPPQQSPLTMATIAAKLAASEREADAARVRAKLKAARGVRGKATTATTTTTATTATTTPSTNSAAPQPTKTEEPQRVPLFSSAGDAQEDVDPVKRSLPEARHSGAVGDGSRRQEEQQQQQQQVVEGQGNQGQQTLPKQRKREKCVNKTASRRRSTLSPWEMQSLISGDVPVPVPVASPAP